MPPSICSFLVAVGLLLFLLSLAQTFVKTRSAFTRQERLKALGALIPGLAGLCLMAAMWVDSPMLRLLLCAAASINLLIGRACYELALGSSLRDKDQ